MKKLLTVAVIFVLMLSLKMPDNRAELQLINKSKRFMFAKVIKIEGRKTTSLYAEAGLAPKTDHIFYFSETGRYFVKTMAVLKPGNGEPNDTLYSKSQPFQVIADSRRGYSRMKMKYTVKENKKSVPTGSIPISKGEYFKD